MDYSESDDSAITEGMWRAWSEKGKRRQRAARKAKVFGVVVLIFLGLGGWLCMRRSQNPSGAGLTIQNR